MECVNNGQIVSCNCAKIKVEQCLCVADMPLVYNTYISANSILKTLLHQKDN